MLGMKIEIDVIPFIVLVFKNTLDSFDGIDVGAKIGML
jgi:hypothetical protein